MPDAAPASRLTEVTLADGDGRVMMVQSRDEAEPPGMDAPAPTALGGADAEEAARLRDGDGLPESQLGASPRLTGMEAELEAEEAAAESGELLPSGEEAALQGTLGRLQARLSVTRLLLAAALVGMFGSLVFGLVMARRSPEILVVRDQAVRPALALDQPVDEVQEWAADAVSRSLAARDVDWRTSARLQDWFTPEGWNSFQAAVASIAPADSSIPFAAQLLGSAEITAQGVEATRYAWHLRQSLRLWREVEGRADTRRVVVDITVVRVPETEHAKGLAISGLVLR